MPSGKLNDRGSANLACDECVRLRTTIRELRDELSEWRGAGDDVLDARAQDYAKKLGIRTQSAKMLSVLLDNAGKAISNDRLAEEIGYDGDNGRRVVAVVLCNLRKSGVPVETVYAKGRRIRLDDVDKIRAML